MTKEELESLKVLLAKFCSEEAEGQGIKELNLEEYDLKELSEAIEEKLNQ